MHSYIIYNKLASLYVCFAMLHTTLHNETEIINAMLQNIEQQPIGWNFTEENSFRNEINNFQIYRNNEEKEVKIFDMILPQRDEEVLLWQKAENHVTIPYMLEPSLSAAQRRAIPDVLRSIEVRTCIRFTVQPGPCDRGGASGGGAKLCFRSGPARAAHLGRRPGGPQAVTLAPEDGPYWVLHLVGHVLGLPHPYTCLRPQQDAQNTTRRGCRSRKCPWRQFDPGSALHLTPDELGPWTPLHTTRLSSASALLSLWRTRRAARPSHWDLLALHELYQCWEGRPRCPPRPCRHGGFADLRCRCVCPPGFSGDDCSVGTGPAQDCVRYVEVEEDLNLPPIGLPGQGAAGPADQCVVRHYGKGQMRSAVGAVPSLNLLILPPILFALMGFNFLVVFVIKKYWEYRYGTAGIYRGTERADWMDQDEEEPEDYQIKVEYSNSFDAIKPGWEGMTRETSVPQAEMTDLELFRSMYGVPARPQPDDTEDEPTPPARAERRRLGRVFLLRYLVIKFLP
ncbi:Blastula protease 10 [Amphibalanus amphitrite]|uniref:Blastula protease 10 n=1 Tax=Amphibalanus amphitrite TaxID=1232801 RepID=A0A6A4VQE7_AMPAM|nr:Blastula protease 10 [Amphibalanus amphitrite]